MPVISCGGMRYQFKWQDVPPQDIPRANQENLEACIHRALELGINHIETARGYGTSEMQLGEVLPKLPRDKMIVQTKVTPRATAEEFLKTFDDSMNYLKLDHVDLLSLHGINNRETLDWSLKKNGCLAAARKLQKEGRCRFIGFSTHGTTDIILEAVNSGEFDYVNLHWYFVNDLNWPAVQAAHRHDMGVFIISPNDKGGKLQEPGEKIKSLCAPLTPMQFNDLYCLNRPEIHTLSCGVAKPSDFDEHVAALKFYDDIPQTIAPIEKRLRAEMEKVLGADWCARWPEGLPNYHGRSRPDQRLGNFAPVDLWQAARTHRVGQDALQSARPGRALVPRRKRREAARTRFARRAEKQSVRRPHSGHPRRSAPDVFREAGRAFEQELINLHSKNNHWFHGTGFLHGFWNGCFDGRRDLRRDCILPTVADRMFFPPFFQPGMGFF